MNLTHLNCATMCPFNARLVNGAGSWLERGEMICHVILAETPDGLALIDTGIGLLDIAHPRTNLGRGFLLATSPRLDPNETAARQVVALGHRIEDVRHVIVTHLDLDHAGGLPDFPKAKVHVHRREHAAAMARATLPEQHRYRTQQFAHHPEWIVHEESGERWFGFEGVRDVIPRTSGLLLIPMYGHTRGHAAIALETASGWLLHAGDAYFHHGELDEPRTCPGGLDAFQRIIAFDDRARRANQVRLQALKKHHGAEVSIVSAHDPVELRREQAKAQGRATKLASSSAS